MDFLTRAQEVVARIPAAERTISAVEAAIQDQKTVLGNLHEVITNLGERLQRVLTPPQLQSSDKATPREKDSHLSHVLREHNEAIGLAVERLQDIMGRLEI